MTPASRMRCRPCSYDVPGEATASLTAATRKPGRVSFRRLERILRSREAKPGLRNVEADSLFDAAMVLDRDGHELLHELKARWIVAR